MRRAMLMTAALLAATGVSACGSQPTTRVGDNSVGGTTDPHYIAAAAEAHRLLDAVTLPPGASAYRGTTPTVLQGPAIGKPATNHLIDLTMVWSLPQSLAGAAAWITTHPPDGLASAGTADGSGPGDQMVGYAWSAPATASYTEAEAEVSLAAAGPDRTVARVDGLDIWISSTPTPDSTSGAKVRLTVSGGCPATIATHVDVANPDPALRSALLPPGRPAAGLICRYSGNLTGQRRLTAATARQLATDVDTIPLGSTGDGPTSCPAAFVRTDVMAFTFPGRPDADLWYQPTGCPTIDNGDIVARATDAAFSSLMASLAP